MYKNIKSCVSFNGAQSSLFQSFRGVRQGESLSPILFAIFLNDHERCIANNGATGINLDLRYDQLTIFLKIFVLLYAVKLLCLVLAKNINFKLIWTYFFLVCFNMET